MQPKVLIIDDDPTIRELLAGGLREQGFHVVQLDDPLQSFPTVIAQKPDVVLLDIMMPGMDGFEVCRTLKQSPETSNTAIVFLSARSAPIDIERGLHLGADDYITKPFDIFQLGDKLLTLIRQRNPLPIKKAKKKTPTKSKKRKTPVARKKKKTIRRLK